MIDVNGLNRCRLKELRNLIDFRHRPLTVMCAEPLFPIRIGKRMSVQQPVSSPDGGVETLVYPDKIRT
jgi:hypothetical protein